MEHIYSPILEQKTDPLSLTLGGYDASRFVTHNMTFTLNPSQQPQVYIDSIFVSSTVSNNWTSPIQLLNSADSVSAIIDSSTPFLWLPQSVCDKFAQNLGLTYNEGLQLYTFDDNLSQYNTLKTAGLDFVFRLSNLATSTTEIVNITLPYEAFDLQATYPFLNDTSYGGTNSSKHYFPIKVATNEAQYTLGRLFLQEAYIITDYERNNFSIHQAKHTGDAIGNPSLVSISPYDRSMLSGNPDSRQKLSSGAIAGIAIAVVLICALGIFAIYKIWRRRHRSIDVGEISTQITSQGRSCSGDRNPETSEYHGSSSNNIVSEVGADAARFELPATLGLAELESDSNTLSGSTGAGSTSSLDSPHLSAYERHRGKVERQKMMNLHHSVSELYAWDMKIGQDMGMRLQEHYRPCEALESGGSPYASPLGPPSGSEDSSPPRSEQPSPAVPHAALYPLPLVPASHRYATPAEGNDAGAPPDTIGLPWNIPSVSVDSDSNKNDSAGLSDLCAGTQDSHYSNTEGGSGGWGDMYNISETSHPRTLAQTRTSPHSSSAAPSQLNSSNGRTEQREDADVSKLLQEDMMKIKEDIKGRDSTGMDEEGGKVDNDGYMVPALVPNTPKS